MKLTPLEEYNKQPKLTPLEEYEKPAAKLTPLEEYKEPGVLEKTVEIGKEVAPAIVPGLGAGVLQIGKGLAGIQRALGEKDAGVFKAIPGVQAYQKVLAKTADFWDSMLDKGLKAITPEDLPDNKAKQITFEVLQNVGSNLPTLIATAPLGPAGPLMAMSAVSAGNKYDELRSKGASPKTATWGAIGQGLIESVTEAISIGKLFKSMPWAKKAISYALWDTLGEEAATILEAGLNKIAIDETITWPELMERIKQTAIVSGISGPIIGGIGARLTSQQKKQFQDKITEELNKPAAVPEVKLTPLEEYVSPEQEMVLEAKPDAIKEVAGNVPAGGLAYGMPLPKYAGGDTTGKGVNLERIDADYDTKFYINHLTEIGYPEIEAMRKEGKRTFDDVVIETAKRFADGTYSMEWALKFDPQKKSANAYEQEAIRQAHLVKTFEARRLSKKAVETNNIEDIEARDKAIEEAMKLNLTNANIGMIKGQELGYRNIATKLSKLAQIKNRYDKSFIPQFAQKLHGKQVSDDILDKLLLYDPADAQGLQQLMKEVDKLPPTKLSDKFYELWMNGILSGPQTNVANIVSNLAVYGSHFGIEKPAAAFIELGRSAATGERRQRFFREGLAAFKGLTKPTAPELANHLEKSYGNAMLDALAIGLQTFKTEMSIDEMTKFEEAGRIGRFGSIPGSTGKFVRLPGRLLQGFDDFFKALAYQSEKYSLAYRQARIENVKGDKFAQRIDELMKSNKFNKKAEDKMRYATFTKELGAFGKQLQKMRSTPIYGINAQKYIIPFVRTPTNIAKYAVERTPLGFLKALRGDHFNIKGANFSDEMAAPAFGTAIMGIGIMLAKSGFLTGGGPKDKNERDSLYRTGWQPYSINLKLFGGPDAWLPIERFEPIASVLGMAADYAEFDPGDDDEYMAALAAAGGSVSKNLLSKTFVSGLSNFLDAVRDPQRYGNNYIKMTTGSLVPNIVGATTRAIEPELKRTETAVQIMQERVPGRFMRDQLYPRRDIWGQPIIRAGEGKPGVVQRMFLGKGVSPVKADVTNQEILRLGINIGIPSNRVTIRGVEYGMTPAEFDEFQIIAGQEAKRLVDRIAKRKMSDKLKTKLIKKNIDQARTRARNYMKRKIQRRVRTEQ